MKADPRLFVTADLPADLLASLAYDHVEVASGIRPSPAENLHLTLHFLGSIPAAPVIEQLERIEAAAFSVVIDGLGRFDQPDGSTVIWARVEPNFELSDLHRTAAEALTPVGYQPEERPYVPHITLASCASSANAPEIDRLFASLLVPRTVAEVASISVYSSQRTDNGSVFYQREARVALA